MLRLISDTKFFRALSERPVPAELTAPIARTLILLASGHATHRPIGSDFLGCGA